jgi:hypothetical protein
LAQEEKVDEPSKPAEVHCPIEDARTLVKAHEITRDKHRFKAVRKHADSLNKSLGVGMGAGKRVKKSRGRRAAQR